MQATLTPEASALRTFLAARTGTSVKVIDRGDAESWSTYLVFERRDGLDAEALAQAGFDALGGSYDGVPGGCYARSPRSRVSHGHVLVYQRGGLDI